MDYDGNILGFLFCLTKKEREKKEKKENISMTGGFTPVREGEDPVRFLLSPPVDYRWAL